MNALREIQFRDEMAHEVEELLSVGSWRRLLSIKEPAILMLTLEVLPSFEFDQSYNSFTSDDTLLLCAFGQYHSISVI